MPALILSLATILVWSTGTLFSAGVSHLPPFLSAGVTLCIGGLVGLARVREWKVPPATFALGVGGIFGYHALFFTALRHAPAVEVNVLQYLWPLLIVVLAPLCARGGRLRWHHLLGACLGLAGGVLVLSGGRLSLERAYLPGYLLALGAAFVWAGYSLLNQRVRPFPTGAVGGFCLASGLLSLGLHALERLARPAPAITPGDWLFLALLGLGPMGLAFYTWDAAMKRGDPRRIGSLAYLTPLLSTLWLVLFGGRHLTALSGCAMGLIVAGAVVGAMVPFGDWARRTRKDAGPSLGDCLRRTASIRAACGGGMGFSARGGARRWHPGAGAVPDPGAREP